MITKEKLRSYNPYIYLGGFILIWWLLAFKAESPSISLSHIPKQSLFINNNTLLNALSPLNRHVLKSALAGDFSLILDLIETWDSDALILIESGIERIHRMHPEKLFQARILATLVRDSSKEDLHALNKKMNLKQLNDDRGETLYVQDHFSRFLPQTYTAASFLLAIADPEKIVALPRGIRQLTQLYSKSQLSKIPKDIEKLHGESLFLQKADLAFIAPYSNPSTLKTWLNQKLPLFSIGHIDTVEEIEEALLKVGHASGQIVEAQLLALFIEAAFLSIDNRLEALSFNERNHQKTYKLLYLKYHQHFFQPTTLGIEGKLVQRLLHHCSRVTGTLSENKYEWQLSFDKEQIIAFNPDIFIVSLPHTKDEKEFRNHILNTPPLNQIKRVFCVDEAIQTSPTQYIALAYFDLFETMNAL